MIYKNKNYELKLYTQELFNDLEEMLILFVEETFPEDVRLDTINARRFADAHDDTIYMLYVDDKPVAFTSFCYNDYYGLRKPTIGNSYLFIKENYRKGIAYHLLAVQAGMILENNTCNFEHYYADGSRSNQWSKRMKGTLVYTTYEYDRDVCLQELKRIRGKFE